MEIVDGKIDDSKKSNTRSVDELHDLVMSYLTFFQTTPAVPAILFSRELHAENEKLRSFFAGIISSRHKLFSKLIAAEIETGQFKKYLILMMPPISF